MKVKALKLKNVKDWQSSVKGIAIAVLAILAVIVDGIDADFQSAFMLHLDQLLIGGAGIFALVLGLFRQNAPAEDEVVISAEDAKLLAKAKAA